jgi:hypothetical protein
MDHAAADGKYEGRNMTSMSRSKKRFRKVIRSYLRSASVTRSATYKPSTWWNIGLCVRSRSFRYTRPGQMIRIGGVPFDFTTCCMVRICTGEVCVRSSLAPPCT